MQQRRENGEEQFTGCRMGCDRPFQSLAKVRIGSRRGTKDRPPARL
jgi:hypothetical protein